MSKTTLSNEKEREKQQLAQATALVGAPKGHWIGDHQWIPAEGSRLYTTDELRLLFGSECTLFVGDSLQRRAADTLHLMVRQQQQPTTTAVEQHTPDVPLSTFTDKYFMKKVRHHVFRERYIYDEQSEGCLASDWRPTLLDVREFADAYRNETAMYGKYSVVVVGSTIWDVVGYRRRQPSVGDMRHRINETIYQLHDQLVLGGGDDAFVPTIVWKSSGWCETCPWGGEVEEPTAWKETNYKVFAANEQARQSIEAINNNNDPGGGGHWIYLDWGREVLPRSIGSLRLTSGDHNRYHYGLTPRLQFIQMLAQVYDERNPHILLKGQQQQQSESNSEESSNIPPYYYSTTTLYLSLVDLAAMLIVLLFFFRRR